MAWFSSLLRGKGDKNRRTLQEGDDWLSSSVACSSPSALFSSSPMDSPTPQHTNRGSENLVSKIVVKKLCLTSRQGLREFVNEVHLLLKVQHKNLVSLLGCCAEGDEKMLVYEFLPYRTVLNY